MYGCLQKWELGSDVTSWINQIFPVASAAVGKILLISLYQKLSSFMAIGMLKRPLGHKNQSPYVLLHLIPPTALRCLSQVSLFPRPLRVRLAPFHSPIPNASHLGDSVSSFASCFNTPEFPGACCKLTGLLRYWIS